MPNTPRVEFNFQNNNVQQSVPLLGVSHVMARTTKGPFNQPDEVFSTYTQFQRVYGEEIVPDGSISNIMKAFEIGSKIRVSRVAGAETTVAKGQAKTYTFSSTTGKGSTGSQTKITIKLEDPNSDDTISMILNINTKEAGSPILDDTGYGLNRNFYGRFYAQEGPTTKIYFQQFKAYTTIDNDPDGEHDYQMQIAAEDIISTNQFFSGSKAGSSSVFVESQVLQDFINNTPNIELVLASDESTASFDDEFNNKLKAQGINGVVSTLASYSNWQGSVLFDNTAISTASSPLVIINEGDNGGKSSAATWVEAYEALKGYSDGYQLIASHIHQNDMVKAKSSGPGVDPDPNGWKSAYVEIAKDVVANFETVLYVEVPKYDSEGKVQTPDGIINQLETLVPQIGYAKNIAYFAGGIKYYDANGALQSCDLLGSVIGLGDASASQYGPWYSFSSMNRGVIASALGPVTENLGGPSKIEELQKLAEWYCNLFVIKDTRTQGKRTMLWHGFTSNPKSDSEKFLSIVRLNLYLKKNLRPIIESYLEEPNTWSTWQSIYYEAKKILDDLIGTAITEYTWMGDQDAQSYGDLVVNNEADVRQGKYHIILKYKEIVPLQEVTMDIVIDSVSKDVNISAE
jgi:hypothetical protein